MAHFEYTIDVKVPIRVAYNQWVQFEDFPRFMGGVKEVEQISDTHMRWLAKIAGVEQEWQAIISEQVPNRRIAWYSVAGARHSGVVTFDYLDNALTSITVQIDYEPNGIIENVGDAFGIVKASLRDALSNFRLFIEGREPETPLNEQELETNPQL